MVPVCLANGACARYPNFNGSHFGLPPSEIHRTTGLPTQNRVNYDVFAQGLIAAVRIFSRIEISTDGANTTGRPTLSRMTVVAGWQISCEVLCLQCYHDKQYYYGTLHRKRLYFQRFTDLQLLFCLDGISRKQKNALLLTGVQSFCLVRQITLGRNFGALSGDV